MPNEITIVSNLTHAAFGSTVTSATTSDVMDDPSDTKRHSLIVQDVGFSVSEAASLGDVNTAKMYWARLRNLDSVNYVSVYVTSGGSDVEIGRMNPGETWGPCRMRAVAAGNPTLKVKADTAACQVEVLACQAEA